MNTTSYGCTETRKSLLIRLQNTGEQEGWREFFRTYWKLIYGTAVKAGLNDAEAQDVVQETVIAVSRNIKKFKIDPGRASFKTWLGTITRSRIVDQFRKRLPVKPPGKRLPGETLSTATIERVPAPSNSGLEAVWENEWQQHLLTAALAALKRKVNPQHYEIFDLHVNKGRPLEEVVRTLGVTANQVYLVKSRLTEMLRNEIVRSERDFAPP
jgi:RNA polymerase sigma-70 factor (ECF subfamily)